MDTIKFVAHRGYQRHYPENTRLAFQKAIDAGAGFIETDVQISADLQPMLYHDRKLKACTGLTGPWHHHPAALLEAARNHEPKRLGDIFDGQGIEPLSVLVALLQANPQIHAFVEVKSVTIDYHGIEQTYRIITSTLAPVVKRCTLISFHRPFMSFARLSGWPSIGIALRRWRDASAPDIEKMAPDYIFADIKDLPKRRHFHDFKATLVIYEVDSPDIAQSLHQRGISFIETFAIGEMQQALSP